MSFDTEKLIRKFSEVNSAHSFTEGSESVHYSKPIDKGMVTELQPDQILKPVMDETPWSNEVERILYDMGKHAGRTEAIATVINLMKENPNIDGLEILKRL